jgi:hypothetical protein
LQVLQQFKLDTTGGGQPGGKIKYNYRCCSVTGQLNEATMFLGIPKAQAQAMSDSQMRGAVIALLMKAGKCTPETAGWCASQSDDELAALCAPDPTHPADGESPAPAPPTVETHAEPTRGWQLRVWNYSNAGSGEFPDFDSDTDSFKMPEPPIININPVTEMMYDNQKWKELGAPDDNFAAVLTGFLDVKEAGQYDFWTESDDGSMLWIDKAMVVDNHGLHAPEKKTGTVSLSKGIHPILVQFFEAGGGAFLKISWKGPDTAGAEQPVDVFQKAAAPPSLPPLETPAPVVEPPPQVQCDCSQCTAKLRQGANKERHAIDHFLNKLAGGDRRKSRSSRTSHDSRGRTGMSSVDDRFQNLKILKSTAPETRIKVQDNDRRKVQAQTLLALLHPCPHVTMHATDASASQRFCNSFCTLLAPLYCPPPPKRNVLNFFFLDQ